ncbi:MAG: AAA family ATPase [Caulobacteraceae bacterium]
MNYKDTLGDKNINTVPVAKAKLTLLSDVEPENIQWLWYPYIPLGKIIIIEGNPGQGKTFTSLALAKHVSLGLPFPEDENNNFEPANVLYLTCEDGLGDTLRPRLDAMGADTSKIIALEGKYDVNTPDVINMISLQDLDILRQVMVETRPKLMVIDPIQGFLGPKVDMNKAEQIRPVLSNLNRLADEFRCAVVIIRHLAKGVNAGI